MYKILCIKTLRVSGRFYADMLKSQLPFLHLMETWFILYEASRLQSTWRYVNGWIVSQFTPTDWLKQVNKKSRRQRNLVKTRKINSHSFDVIQNSFTRSCNCIGHMNTLNVVDFKYSAYFLLPTKNNYYVDKTAIYVYFLFLNLSKFLFNLIFSTTYYLYWWNNAKIFGEF